MSMNNGLKNMKASEVEFDPRKQMSSIFIEGFYKHLKGLTPDKDKLTSAFEHTFDLEKFFVAIDDEKVAAITSCTDGRNFALIPNKKILRKELGFWRGSIAYIVITKYLQIKYPFDLEDGTGSIELVATCLQYRNRRVAFALINHLLSVSPFRRHVLEVVYDNVPAVKLYKNLGFKEVMKIKPKHSKRSGIDFFSYMRRD